MINILEKTKEHLKKCIKYSYENINTIRMNLAKGQAGPSTIMVIKLLEQDIVKYNELVKKIEEDIKKVKTEKELREKTLKYKIAKFLHLI